MEEQEKYEVEPSALGRIVITEAQVDLIKNTVALGATDDELKLFFYECRRRGVHPLDRLIHFVKRKSKDGTAKATFQAGIDFLRSQAEETGEYRGQEAPEFGPSIQGTNYPEWAKVTVLRVDKETGQVFNVPGLAFWEEYCPPEGMNFMWKKMPRGQLSKCAEALALRKAFPKKIQGLYSFEEMEQADMIEAPHKPQGKPPVEQPQRKSANGQGQNQRPPASPDDPYPPASGNMISEPQRKRFWALAKGAGRTDEEIKSFLYIEIGSEDSAMIDRAHYDIVCAKVQAPKEGNTEEGPA